MHKLFHYQAAAITNGPLLKLNEHRDKHPHYKSLDTILAIKLQR